MPAIVTLLTDFGLCDTYVGQMKGVMLSIDPTLQLVDLTHEIPPQDVLEGAFQLATAIMAFPSGTVHLAVVDPGVGTSRRAILVQTGGGFFVGPDNGLFSFVYEAGLDAAYELESHPSFLPSSVSPTFHGRDLFAPFAASIASNRVKPDDAGPRIDPATLVRLDIPNAEFSEAALHAPILSIDRFGNCLTLVRPEHLPDATTIVAIESGAFFANQLSETYADVPSGEPIALIGSNGALELAERNGNAAERWSLQRGDIVTVHFG